ncbi:hypothetical protein ASE73_01175 [Sphingomonas sp. Leaf24]|uniref:hypothetical protein n=1 Tax=unclassified Sphingomonas TaxID=196159 RepID=UPI0006F50393|nr:MULTISPECIES: hypothetical protein [unclassified Sphingomonas]KQM22882.1 hypothetical protein ASE50_01175 [Sphingomonas sp. Leaf5]KQM84881.1 hypothetical protein ASE70_04850 [Sphingomonas sp. Leaf22]KQM95737.1 hypothetical protein ASE73_01175 [Sphingomonas sp. Leaf24]
MTKFIAPLAAIALVGLGGCSGNEPANSIDANASIETNLTSVDEPLANDIAVGNAAIVSNDTTLATDPALNATVVDPTPTTTGNATGL